MNFFKKSMTVAAIAVAVAAAFVSCKEKVDLTDTMIEQSASKIPGVYTMTDVDTVSMTTTVYEYEILSDEEGQHGSYTVAKITGDGYASTESLGFTWTRGDYSDDLLSIVLNLQFNNGTKQVKWGSAAIDDGEHFCNGPARSVNLMKVADNFPNNMWAVNDTALWVDHYNDTIPYVNFTQKVVKNMTQDMIDQINAYYASPEGAAAIAWFNENMNPAKPVTNTVTVAKTNADGTFAVKYFAWTNDTLIRIGDDTLGVKSITKVEMKMMHTAGQPNQGIYKLHLENYSHGYYSGKAGEESTASVEDYNYTVSHWGIGFNGSLLNAKNFSVIMRGNMVSSVHEEKDGVSADNAYDGQMSLKALITGFDIAKSTIVIEGVKCAKVEE